MTIILEETAKRFGYDWVFRNLSYTFQANNAYAILGHNGAGKSTLMQVLSGHLSPSKGRVRYENEGGKIGIDDVFRYVSYAAPYIDLIEEFTLAETVAFHQKFKPFAQNLSTAEVIDLLQLPKGSTQKPVQHFSSGMRQRLKIALALTAETPIVLLDEPTTNLDLQGVEWYSTMIERFKAEKLLVIASNTPHDYHFCNEKITITDYK